MADLKHAAERKAFEIAIDGALHHIDKHRGDALIQMTNIVQKILGDTWPDAAYDRLRATFADPNSKWMQYADKLFDEVDHRQLKLAALNLGYESGFRGYKDTRALGEKEHCNIPWVILMDPTSACNLHCTGCWAAEYGHKMNLTYEDMDSIVNQGEKMGIHTYLFTGGEPLVRKADLIKLCENHPHDAFQTFTNGTLIDEDFCKEMKRVGNLVPSISLEGFEEVNDGRRGQGVFDKVMHAMDLMKEYGLLFGTSICYTSKNYKTVTSDEFLDMEIEKGVRYSWYFHFMPVGNDATPELMLNPEQREYMYHRIREIRGFDTGKPIFTIDFQNDGEFVGGCVAGGREYCHINPNGDVEPCVFIHYSSANIHDKSLLECFKQPIFMKYYEGQPFNDNMLRPCPMLENPDALVKIVEETGAKSTDMQSPEDVHSLCAKCEAYAKAWKPTADKLWKQSQEERVERMHEAFKTAEHKKAPEATKAV